MSQVNTQNKKTKISIVVLNYKTPDLTIRAVKTAQTSCGDIPYELFLVDNASGDDSVERFKQELSNITLIKNKYNSGFSAGNNVAIRQATGDYVLLLNSDTEVIGDAIEKSIAFMDQHREVGALGCRIQLPNGELDHACKRGFPTPSASFYYFAGLAKKHPESPKYAAYTTTYLSDKEINEVDAIMGAYMMVRREAMEQVGILDEQFFMYGEDIDWCYRIKQAGWRIVYFAEAIIIHYKYGSRSKRAAATIKDFHRAMIIFYKKHYRKKYPIIIYWIIVIAVKVKCTLQLVLNFITKT
jgi:GT2 family glycosyltransferase